ncbi:DNA repair protein RadA [Bacillus atrophaeus subsp. globigii]|nr:DNA repair protein RadA [Bacillus atrophaeus subsp. globigii]KFK80981.1 DNA repair protein RadA [Bacillus atrophaeus]KYD07010.1 hypothetical protein B4144_0151 [Bacillus atrophaeus]
MPQFLIKETDKGEVLHHLWLNQKRNLSANPAAMNPQSGWGNVRAAELGTQ